MQKGRAKARPYYAVANPLHGLLMADNFSTVRSRLHKKSHDYFVFSHGRWDRTKRSMFYGATDALLDTSQASESYEHAITSNMGANLLACYGFLQALYIQQDAVITLSRAVGLSWHPNSNERLKQIRDARNRLTGHPALAGARDSLRRLSSAIIAYDDITPLGFRGHVYYEDGFEDIKVDVAAFRKDNEDLLSLQMEQVEQKMDEQESKFRIKEALHPLSSVFTNQFSYLMQRLSCDLTDEGRNGQAQTHAKMIREIMIGFQNELATRGFASEAASYHLRLIFTGLNRLEAFMSDSCPTQEKQDEFDLIYAGIEKNVRQLMNFTAEIDTRLRTPTHEQALRAD
jgi:hypothetical protein